MSILRIDKNRGVDRSLKAIETQIIKPIQIDENSCTFVFRNTGSIDRNCTIVLPVVSSTAETDLRGKSQLSLTAGILGLIKSATLYAGGVVICSTEEVGHHYAMRNSFKTNEERRNLEFAKTGVMSDWGVSNAKIQANVPTSKSCIRSHLDYTWVNDPVGTLKSVPGAYDLTADTATTARLFITLEQLFPSMFGHLLMPLQLVSEEVSLKIRFSGDSLSTNDYINFERGIHKEGEDLPKGAISIHKPKVEMLVDYLYYDDISEAVNQVMGEGMRMDYGDVITNKVFLPKCSVQPADDGSYTRTNYVRQIGATGRVIRNIVLCNVPQAEKLQNGGSSGLQGKYMSMCGSRVDKGEQVQFKINNIPLLQSHATQDGYKWALVNEVYGLPLQCPTGTYSHKGQVHDSISGGNVGEIWTNNLQVASNKYLGWKQQDTFTMNSHYLGIDLHKPVLTSDGSLKKRNVKGAGTLIGQAPIQIEYERWIGHHDWKDINQIIFMTAEKTAVLKDGVFSVTDT